METLSSGAEVELTLGQKAMQGMQERLKVLEDKLATSPEELKQRVRTIEWAGTVERVLQDMETRIKKLEDLRGIS